MNEPEHFIDARGHRCPVPTLKLRKYLESLSAEAQVTLWADDPMVQIDVPHFCIKNNYILESSYKTDEFWVFVVTCAPRIKPYLMGVTSV
ncbi:sulfurtransferase TusA family protein [Asticcacaulis endophyticus]|jgi:tRNA 2-thiouridine synthesizing protein A|uniref:sulfurtransferase TusA family protein n=2 Tax=Asticcacaulis TaxID=76890 RepID=UPI0016725136|nr:MULTISPECIES: sulfurtransferase TusA family protein [Asticcacaulis]WKL56621.1 sulfurtransferase TusA family protein [Asticcacaulis sp. ZE23SCel15]